LMNFSSVGRVSPPDNSGCEFSDFQCLCLLLFLFRRTGLPGRVRVLPLFLRRNGCCTNDNPSTRYQYTRYQWVGRSSALSNSSGDIMSELLSFWRKASRAHGSLIWAR
jgi:hypothetical protein